MIASRYQGPCLAPHRYHPGDTVGRWTVVRHASPVERWHGTKVVRRHRVYVRCICGYEKPVEELALAKRRTRGCTSRMCHIEHGIRTRLDQVGRDLDAIERRANEYREEAKALEKRLADALERGRALRERYGLPSRAESPVVSRQH